MTSSFATASTVRWLVLLMALSALAGCGPRSDATGSSGVVPSGEVSFINPFKSSFPTPNWRMEADQVVFPVRFDMIASDADGDMQRFLVSVSYTDCNGVDQVVDNLVYWLSVAESVAPVVHLVDITNTEVQIPLACYAQGGAFTISGRILDKGNNRSKSISNVVTVTANQGSTGL